MILLTGATGFLGSRLLKKLLDEKYSVVCLKRRTSDLKRVDGFWKKCEWIDIEEKDYEYIFEKYNVNVVIHCATEYGKNKTDTIGVYNSNLVFPLKLLECANKYDCRLFINTSTFFVREVNSLWTQEKLYADSYVKSKFVFSQIAKDSAGQLRLRFVNLQLEHVYGNDGRESKFVDWLLNALRSNNSSIELTSGKQVRDWVYIDDVVDAYIVVLNNLESFRESAYYHYEVGTGKGTSLKEFVLLAHELAESTATLVFGAREMAPNELMYSCADNKSLCELGWHPKTDITQGIIAMLGKA